MDNLISIGSKKELQKPSIQEPKSNSVFDMSTPYAQNFSININEVTLKKIYSTSSQILLKNVIPRNKVAKVNFCVSKTKKMSVLIGIVDQ